MFARYRCKVHLCGTDRSGHALPRHRLDPASRSIANSYRVCFMPLFVTLRKGYRLVPGIPQTVTGKKMEVPIRRILSGTPVDRAVDRESMANPEVLEAFIAYAQSRSTAQGPS